MKSITINGITIYFDKNGEPFLDIFVKACNKSIPIIYEMWGLGVPEKCKIFIATTWLKFQFCSASWPEKILYAIYILLNPIKSCREWKKSGGYTSRFYPTSVIKVRSLIDSKDRKVWERIFFEESSLEKNFEISICHELVHACSLSFKLPSWLNEGIAMYTCDKYIGRSSVKLETINFLQNYPQKNTTPPSRDFMSLGKDAAVYFYSLSYWLTRYFEQDHPGQIKDFFDRHLSGSQIEKEIGDRLQTSSSAFWEEINKWIVARFKIENSIS